MNIDKDTEMKTGMDRAALAEQRDDERQQAEAEAAQKMLQQMQNSAKDEPAKDNTAKTQEDCFQFFCHKISQFFNKLLSFRVSFFHEFFFSGFHL